MKAVLLSLPIQPAKQAKDRCPAVKMEHKDPYYNLNLLADVCSREEYLPTKNTKPQKPDFTKDCTKDHAKDFTKKKWLNDLDMLADASKNLPSNSTRPQASSANEYEHHVTDQPSAHKPCAYDPTSTNLSTGYASGI